MRSCRRDRSISDDWEIGKPDADRRDAGRVHRSRLRDRRVHVLRGTHGTHRGEVGPGDRDHAGRARSRAPRARLRASSAGAGRDTAGSRRGPRRRAGAAASLHQKPGARDPVRSTAQGHDPSAPPRQLGALIGSTAPGTNVVAFPEGTALRLRAGTVLTFQMHYTAHGHAMKDRSSVGFRFAKEMPNEEIHAAAFTNGAFTIPAGARDYQVPAEIGVSQPVKIWGLLPHTHLRGTRWLYTLVKPDSTQRGGARRPAIRLQLADVLPLREATRDSRRWQADVNGLVRQLHFEQGQPRSDSRVKWGDQTWEEMQYTGFLYSVPSRRLRPSP